MTTQTANITTPLPGRTQPKKMITNQKIKLTHTITKTRKRTSNKNNTNTPKTHLIETKHLFQKTTSHQTTGHLNKTIANYAQTLALQPLDSHTYNNLNITLHTQNKPQTTLTSYHQTQTLKPKNPNLHSNINNILHTLDHLKKTTANIKHSIKLQPKTTDP